MTKKDLKKQDDDLSLKKENLIEKAKDKGQISQKEIYDLYPDNSDNVEKLDNLYTELASNNIDILSDEPLSITPDLSEDWSDEEITEDLSNETFFIEDDIADDSVRS